MDQSVKPSEFFVDIGVVTRLLEILAQNQKAAELATVQGLVDTITLMENNLNTAMAELKIVKTQLDTISAPKSTVKETAIQQVQKLESGFKRLKNQLNGVKGKFVGTAQNIVEAVQEKGISALDKTSDFIHLKENFTALNQNINKSISRVNKNINTINTMTQEIKESVKHTQNIGRIIMGKERDVDMSKPSENMVKPLRVVKKMLVNMESKSANAVDRVDLLAKRAGREETQHKKPSVLQKLKDEKANITEPKATNPKAKEMAI